MECTLSLLTVPDPSTPAPLQKSWSISAASLSFTL